jgi:hypothetical protein
VITGQRFIAKNLSFINCSVAIDIQGGVSNTNLIGIVYGSGVTTKIKAPAIYSFNPSNVNINPTNTIAFNNSLASGAIGVFTTTGNLPSGLSLSTPYYVVNPTSTHIQVASTLNGVALSLFDQGTGIHSFGDGSLSNLEAKTEFNTWIVSDGTNTYGVGDFNSPNAIQQAHDAAASGDIIHILPGVYNIVAISQSRLQFIGLGGGGVKINGQGSSNACLAITGSYNQFDNLTLENAAVGIDCRSGSSFNKFSPTVIFSNNIQIFVRMPATATTKHYNYHPLVCGRVTSGASVTQQNTEVTVGDGSVSWGDYVGANGINVALASESQGTKIRVWPGSYNPISINNNNFVLEGSGATSVIRATAPTDLACITIVNVPPVSGGEGNRVSGFYLLAINNQANGLKTIGVKITGNDNYIEDIKFEATGPNRIEPNLKYQITSGFRNKFVPHTGAPTGYISWTVGDGVHSFGDFNGTSAITQAINALPTGPTGTLGVFSGAAGSTVTFSDSSLTFVVDDVYRYLCIQASVNPNNIGLFEIISQASTSVVLKRYDGLSFVNETGVYWNFTSGAKIWVLPGQYSPFTIPSYRNNIELSAWGAGGDTIIIGASSDTPLLMIDGNFCRIKGFRFVGGVPLTGVAIALNGMNNTFESNRYETAVRYSFGSYAFGNMIYDAPEAVTRTYLTVSVLPSRGDFVGSSQASIQAALDAASLDSNINRVILGKGVWTLSSTITLPAGITLEGSGYQTELIGTGAFAALTLNSSGNQTVKGIRFNNFSNSLIGPASGVFAYNNWLQSATINGNVTGSVSMNI